MEVSIPRARRFMRRSLRGSLVLARDLLDRRISRLQGVEGRLMAAATSKKALMNPEEDRPAGVQ